MITAKCNRCLGSATGTTFEEAKSKINHAVALQRGIPCGDNYDQVVQVTTPKTESKFETYKRIEGKSGKKVQVDESKKSPTEKSRPKDNDEDVLITDKKTFRKSLKSSSKKMRE